MFGNMKDMMDQLKLFQDMMKDENFRAFMTHPKVKELLSDPEVIAAFKSRDSEKILNHPRLAALQSDPELARLLAELKPPAGGKRPAPPPPTP